MLCSFSMPCNDFRSCILIILRYGVENCGQFYYGELGSHSRERRWTQQRTLDVLTDSRLYYLFKWFKVAVQTALLVV